MALKRKQSVTYVTDTGKELEVNEMIDTHLMNAMAHHQKQIDVLTSLGPDHPDYIHKRIQNLRETIVALYQELAFRDPDREEAQVSKRWQDNDRGY